ncbi:E3 ubiquitin-protein ligase RNF19B-like isoform X3 [Alligator sinensis]|uniref:RBR-type E3 ubiquitin transferase n=1 Tax=Alligator sinensis TaxID=38654 RepID=A0A3Q0FRZ6_ALLSI|nr:E3 ubiquitin-protein ligase RNF19B-like isoform X3 [Alligator sinensis]
MKQPKQPPRPFRILGLFGRQPRAPREVLVPEPTPGGPAETRVTVPPGKERGLVECPLCLLPQPPDAFPTLSTCTHRSCRTCLETYLRIEVGERRVPVACPHCPAALLPTEVCQLLPEPALRNKYEEHLLRRLLAADPGTRWCPAPDCSYAVIAYGCDDCPRLTCGREGCGTEFCYHCRQPWHPGAACAPVPGTTDPGTLLIHPEEAAHDAGVIKVCPRCGAFIMKINDGSCNRMSCTMCGCLFCWLCLREVTDVHFLSPSGCTFWGKRPWSRTRKLLWQLGMVLGAPMVISLIAGIAVPVITIGLPVYMGRKVLGRSRKSNLSGCQRCLSVSSSVLLSLVVSPIITAVTVVNELWAVLPNPRAAEDVTPDTASSLPSSSSRRRSQRHQAGCKDQDIQSASTTALAGSILSEGQDASYREGVNFEVEVAIEAEPRAGQEQSLCSAPSGHSLSGDSLGCASDACSTPGALGE